ncbi:hypothetical protein TIFTF001_038850 [Ficus carica]|uniref:Cytochrome P450 n=1 Tax=Ficus carica TaxID=3494 RepID=A0AA88E8F8_FICCA|nr:hypothetical protein TIFTF001_038850 [Ficus carica]
MNPQDEHAYIVGRTNIKAILLDMIVAAFDTSAITIEWTISELLRNTRVMQNLQKQLENVVGRDHIVEGKYLEKIEYLDMALKESLRLHPIAPFSVPCKSLKDIKINGYFIPKKSRILIKTWAIGRDSSVWSENVEEFTLKVTQLVHCFNWELPCEVKAKDMDMTEKFGPLINA